MDFEDSTADDAMEEEGRFDEEEEEEEEDVDLSLLPAAANDPASTLIPLISVPWASVPKNGVRPFCHVENCKIKVSSKNALAMHLATNHDNYIIDVSGSGERCMD